MAEDAALCYVLDRKPGVGDRPRRYPVHPLNLITPTPGQTVCTEDINFQYIQLKGLAPGLHSLHAWLAIERNTTTATEGMEQQKVHAPITFEASSKFRVLDEVRSPVPWLFETAPTRSHISLSTNNVAEPRFVPSGEVQTRSAIYTMWNVLDKLMERHAPEYVPKYGYLRKTQLDLVSRIYNPEI